MQYVATGDSYSTRARFQYRKRYKGACNGDGAVAFADPTLLGFNTVNGIRVHAIVNGVATRVGNHSVFQYRKRYKGACNIIFPSLSAMAFWAGFNTVNGIRVHAI